MFLSDRKTLKGRTWVTIRDDDDLYIHGTMIGVKRQTSADYGIQVFAGMLAFEAMEKADQIRAVVHHRMERGRDGHDFKLRISPQVIARLGEWNFRQFTRSQVLRAVMKHFLKLATADQLDWIAEAHVLLAVLDEQAAESEVPA